MFNVGRQNVPEKDLSNGQYLSLLFSRHASSFCLRHVSSRSLKAVSLSGWQDQKVVPVTAYLYKGAACRGVAVISPERRWLLKGIPVPRRSHVPSDTLPLLSVIRKAAAALCANMRANGLREGLSELITVQTPIAEDLWTLPLQNNGQRPVPRNRINIDWPFSMGAATTMMEAGARNSLGMKGTDAFDAYIVLSPQGLDQYSLRMFGQTSSILCCHSRGLVTMNLVVPLGRRVPSRI